jgi:hypothetical protein
VCVTEIDDWEDQWRELHLGCTDPPEGDDNEEDGDDNYDVPSRCCGEQRPNPQDMTLVVKALGEFVTVHDYVSAVHPWLIHRRDDLLGALAVPEYKRRLYLPAGEHLMVTFGGPDRLSAGTKEDWLRSECKQTHLQVGETPVLTSDTPYVELRADDYYGPPPGYTGPWPIPYNGALAVDLSHWGVRRAGEMPDVELRADLDYGPPPGTGPWPIPRR